MSAQIHYSEQRELSEEALRLVEFDRATLGQLIASRREAKPALWLATPAGYQDDKHVLRDSPSIRLMAYSEASRSIYATDGCNACVHTLEASLGESSDSNLVSVSERTQLPTPMLKRLKELLEETKSE